MVINKGESASVSSTILVVDDEKKASAVFERILTGQGYRVVLARNGQEALDIVETTPVDLILLDIMMPGLSGLEACRTLKQNPRRRFVPVILMTGIKQREERIKGIEAGADDFLSKPINAPEVIARIRSLLRLKTMVDQLDSAAEVILSLAEALGARDAYTASHVRSVAATAVALGREMRLPEEEIDVLRYAGILHDIGKIGVPDSILQKRGSLSEEEIQVVRKHTVIGHEICKPLKTAQGLLEIVLHHHEKLDGSGYPHGLRNGEISLTVRIVAVADIYDALTSDRSYRSRMSAEDAFGVLDREAEARHIDADVLQALKKSAGA
ncbi:MAG: response regulator [Nitrospinae bacterium]|nr:response regulator [Nitrospinota bacterium]